jgi:hypothetical protein
VKTRRISKNPPKFQEFRAILGIAHFRPGIYGRPCIVGRSIIYGFLFSALIDRS